MRRTVSFVLALIVASSPALAQQPIQDAAANAATAAARDTDAAAQADAGRRTKFWTGSILSVAGATAIILGSTVFKDADATSGNTPKSGFDSCEALKANPVYSGNDCDVLKGPNTAIVIGGALAAATGATLMMLGLSNSSVAFGPGQVSLRHRVRF